jgi:hypothetical protein
MDIKSFQKAQKKLLENSEVAAAWLEYQSKFPYVSAYYRSADDYRNQISVVNGRKAGTDINLYKLFLEAVLSFIAGWWGMWHRDSQWNLYGFGNQATARNAIFSNHGDWFILL